MAIGVRSTSYQLGNDANGDVTGGTLACAKPAGVVSGDLLVAFVCRAEGSTATTAFTATGWTAAGFFAGATSPNKPPVGVLYKVAGGSEPASYTFTSVGFSGADQFLIHMLALTGTNTSTPILVAPAKTDGASNTAACAAPSASPAAAGGLLLTWHASTYYGTGLSWSPPSGMAERVDQGGIWLHPATYSELRAAAGATGTRTATLSTTPQSGCSPRGVSLVINPGGGVPILDAGADASGPQFTAFTRTAGEDNNGSTITSRSWTIAAGPVDVGTTIGTAAALSWTPYAAGDYTLRYAATNANGTGTDDLAFTATTVDHLGTAALALTADPGAAGRLGMASPSAPLALGAILSAAKTQVAASVTAPLALAGEGVEGSFADAPMTLGASAAAGSVRSGSVSAVLALAAPTAAGSSRAAAAVAALTLAAHATTERIILAINRVPARPSLAITYELVAVARIPAASGPPTLMEIDAITWTGLSWTDELSKAQSLAAGCQISSLTEPVLQRLRNLAELPTELWVYRNGKLVFAGPLQGGQVQGEGLSLNARGLLSYLDYMVVQQDLVFTGVDQSVIATTLIDQWQSLDYGHYGIDTTGVPTTGVLRDATYLRRELHPVGQRVAEQGARINGYDVAVNPASRKLVLAHPQAGQDRSIGEDAIVFDSSNVTSPNLVFSDAPGDVASEAYATNSGQDADALFSLASNPQVRARFGRAYTSATFDGVKDQATLDDHAAAMLGPRAEAFLVPGPDTRVTPDSNIAAYDVGDTVSYTLHEQLSVTGPYRLRKRRVTVAKTGQEAVSVEFV